MAAEEDREAPARVFVFVNPTAGGGGATAYLQALAAPGGPLLLDLGGCLGRVELRGFSLLEGCSGRKPGFLEVKSLSEAVDAEVPIRVMVAGGDGAVVWALSELIETGVDMRRVAIGHIPFGTGNDFARSTGWGPGAPANVIGAGREVLLRDLRRWMLADVVDFDVWEVQVTTAPDGDFCFVHGQAKGFTEGDKKRHRIEELQGGGWRMKKPMVNYFSLGQCCRAGLGFEKRRTRSRTGNNMRYMWEGLKKIALRPAPLVSDVLEGLVIEDVPNACSEMPDSPVDKLALGACSPSWLQPQNSTISFDGQASGVALLAERSSELLFLNIPSFAGGADPWAWAKRHGLVRAPRDPQPWEACACVQSVGDKRLEVLTYGSNAAAGADVLNGKVNITRSGYGRRLASAHGPFVANFKAPAEARYTSADGRVYFQIDGEFFVARKPQEATVRHWRTVRVLNNPQAPVRCSCAF